jgi:hypothetical protein
MHDLPPQGSIDEVFTPRLVAGLHVEEFEGMLRLTLPDAIRVLYFRRGEIASAASNAEPDRLANILIREGRLTAEQLEMARARLQAGASLGKALIEMGFLTPSELLQGARHQVRAIVASCFAATTGIYEMVPGPLPAEVTPLGLNTRRLLFDCLVEAGERAAIVRELGSMEAVYRPTGHLDAVLGSLKLDFETDRIGQLLDGSASLRDISGRTSHDDFTVGKVVLALDLLGAAERVRPSEEATPAAERGLSIPILTEAPPEPEEPAAAEVVIDAPDAEAPAEDAVAQAPAAVAVSRAIETTPLPAASSDPSADEPPPIPQDELPAFAQFSGETPGGPGTAPGPEVQPQWQIDPETGERVHVGPIEVTFDGRIATGAGETKSSVWLLMAAGAVTLVVAGSLGYVMLRRGGAPAVPATAIAATPTEPAPGTASEVEPPLEESAQAPGTLSPVPTLAPETAPAREPAGLAADPRFVSAARRLDRGDVAGAARLFEEWIVSERHDRLSLQLMIACQDETVKAARSRAGTDGALFILPYALKDRACYRVCWGVYEDPQSARAAISAIPPALTGETVPLVVPLSRLRRSG